MGKIVCSPIGGLGNLLYQAAFSIKIAKENNFDALLDQRRLEKYNLHKASSNTVLLKRIFQGRNSSLWWHHELVFRAARFFRLGELYGRIGDESSVCSLKSRTYFLDGYFQKYEYIEEVLDYIREAVVETVNELTNGMDEIDCAQYVQSCGVQIRRGDYFSDNNRKTYGVCDDEYFKEAMRVVSDSFPGISFNVFSDDVEWCKKNIKIDNVSFVESSGEPVIELYKLSLCRALVISNSSFGAWASYLGSPDFVIAPEKWVYGRNTLDLGLAPAYWKFCNVN